MVAVMVTVVVMIIVTVVVAVLFLRVDVWMVTIGGAWVMVDG